MDLSYTIQDPPSTETVTSLLSEINIGALKVEVEIEDILKGEIPSVVREVLTEIIGQCHHWREEAWNRIQAVEQAEFTFIKAQTHATAGNISVQISKLKQAGYIQVTKKFNDNKPQTNCKITKKGVLAFEKYVENLKVYLSMGN